MESCAVRMRSADVCKRSECLLCGRAAQVTRKGRGLVRVMTYNILNGGLDGASGNRLERIIGIVKAENPDILVFNEAMHFSEHNGAHLYMVERAISMRGLLAIASTGQHVCVFIRPSQPILSLKIDTEHFHHALVRVQLQTQSHEKLTVLGTHLCPHGSLNRLLEAQRITNDSKDDHDVVLMGDLNSLDHYSDHTKQVAGLAPRYRARHLVPGELSEVDTRVTRTLEAAGFIDLGYRFRKEADDITTAPTKLGTAGHEFSGMRVDYIYTNKRMSEKAKSYRVLRSPETDYASDHYPVIVDFDIVL